MPKETPGVPIEQAEQLRPHHRALKALGYRTVEQFVAAAHAAKPALANYLKTDIDKLLEAAPKRARERVRAFAARPLRPLALGVALERIPRPRVAFAVSPPPPPEVPALPQVNLISQMPPIRDQANRGTCVAHAALAVFEYHAKLNGSYEDMSEQFLYWNCKQRDGDPNNEGTWLGVAFPMLYQEGCCRESTWPYNPNPIPGNEGQGPPPSSAQTEALRYRVATFLALPPTSVQDFKHELLQRRCVAFSIPVFDSWLNSVEVRRTGEITLPIPNEQTDKGHAMCIAGFEDLPGEVDIGGGRFLVRNSWDSYWATESPLGVGYGTIPYAYIARFGAEAYSVQ